MRRLWKKRRHIKDLENSLFIKLKKDSYSSKLYNFKHNMQMKIISYLLVLTTFETCEGPNRPAVAFKIGITLVFFMKNNDQTSKTFNLFWIGLPLSLPSAHVPCSCSASQEMQLCIPLRSTLHSETSDVASYSVLNTVISLGLWNTSKQFLRKVQDSNRLVKYRLIVRFRRRTSIADFFISCNDFKLKSSIFNLT